MAVKTTALVTGASGGIGLEFARLLAKEGHDLALVARNEGKLLEIKDDFESGYKVKVTALGADLSRQYAAKEVFDSLSGVDIGILINNAGTGGSGPYADSDWEKDAAMINLNILSLAHMTRLFLPAMVGKKSGMICNLASTAAFEPGPLMSIYYASKAFVFSFSMALSEELKGSGVTVTALCPGPTLTGFQAAAGTTGMKLHDMLPMQTPDIVAAAGLAAMKKGKPFVIPGFINYMTAFSTRFAPYSVLTPMVKGMNSKKKSDGN